MTICTWTNGKSQFMASTPLIRIPWNQKLSTTRKPFLHLRIWSPSLLIDSEMAVIIFTNFSFRASVLHCLHFSFLKDYLPTPQKLKCLVTKFKNSSKTRDSYDSHLHFIDALDGKKIGRGRFPRGGLLIFWECCDPTLCKKLVSSYFFSWHANIITNTSFLWGSSRVSFCCRMWLNVQKLGAGFFNLNLLHGKRRESWISSPGSLFCFLIIHKILPWSNFYRFEAYNRTGTVEHANCCSRSSLYNEIQPESPISCVVVFLIDKLRLHEWVDWNISDSDFVDETWVVEL